MKNFLLGLTVGILLVPLSTSAVAQLLSDVETGSWYEPAVVRMQELGILQGYSDGTFKPKKAVTRAELAVVMDRAIQTSCAEAKVSQDSPFNCDNVTQQSDPAAKRDAQRRSDVNTILSSIYQWAIDHQGAIPTGITSVSTEICVNSQSSCVGKVRLDELVGTYVVRIPIDPLSSGIEGSGYFVKVGADSELVTVSAPSAETSDISVTR